MIVHVKGYNFRAYDLVSSNPALENRVIKVGLPYKGTMTDGSQPRVCMTMVMNTVEVTVCSEYVVPQPFPSSEDRRVWRQSVRLEWPIHVE